MNIIKISKLLILALGLIVSCDRPKEVQKQLYMRVLFQDHFDKDLIKVYFDNQLIVNNDTLTSGRSTGLTNLMIDINQDIGNKYFDIIIRKRLVKSIQLNYPIKLTVFINGHKKVYSLHRNRGIYVSIDKADGNNIFLSQSHKRPVFD